MNAVVYRAPYDIRVESVPNPTLQDGRDAIGRLTSSALCGSDLHMYRGHVPPDPGLILGHEGMGVIMAVGDRIIGDMARLVNAGGSLGVMGVYVKHEQTLWE